MRILELHRQSRDERRSVHMNKQLARFMSTKKSPILDESSHIDHEDTDEPETDTFRDAADRLNGALGDDCGVAFLDTVGISTPYPASSPEGTRRASIAPVREYPFNDEASTTTQPARGPSPVLASSGDSYPRHLLPISLEQLSVFAERYSQGMLWTFEDDESGETSDNELQARDGQYLQQHIPKVSSIFLKPIWNAQANRTVVCICYSKNAFRVLTDDHEIPAINSFCNTLSMELVRLATVESDEQKSGKPCSHLVNVYMH